MLPTTITDNPKALVAAVAAFLVTHFTHLSWGKVKAAGKYIAEAWRWLGNNGGFEGLADYLKRGKPPVQTPAPGGGDPLAPGKGS